MALNGRLEELNLLEILQIIAFAKKTGTLRVKGTLASGAVLFHDGLILCALSSSTQPILRPMAGMTLDESRAQLLHDEIRIALRELVSLREGTFEFVLSARAPTEFEGMDVSKFLVKGGVDPQEVLLDLAREIDVDRRDSTSLLEGDQAPPEAPNIPPAATFDLTDAALTVLVVDDERQVLDAVRDELESAGCTVETAATAGDALARIDSLARAERSLALVTDVAMPDSHGESFQGGFELIEHLQELGSPVVALLMTESLSPEARERARALDIRKVAFKPALTKLDETEYAADLRSFASVVRRELTNLLDDAQHIASPSPSTELNHDVIFDFLKTMTDQLTQPANGIARMILRVGAKYCERAILFLVKRPQARGLAALHAGRLPKHAAEEARTLVFDIQEVPPFAEVVYSRSPLTLAHDKAPLPPRLEPGKAREYVLLPLLHNHEVLSILFCDNPNTGRPLGNLSGLALFLTQAGMAMENASLHRKVRSFENQFSLEDQGPLTQELTKIIRGRE